MFSLSLLGSLTIPWESELWQDQSLKKHDQSKTEVLLVLNRFFNVRDDFRKDNKHIIQSAKFSPCPVTDCRVFMSGLFLGVV